MRATLDQIMEAASVALARTDYLLCEQKCLEALALARRESDWAYYAKILLPLQESRRQRRSAAAEGVIRLGSGQLEGDPETWLAEHPTGCVLLTRPHDAETARALHTAAGAGRLNVEVLLADCGADEPRWLLRTFAGPAACCTVAAPPAEWRERPLAGHGDTDASTAGSPANWFLDAAEALGDATAAGSANFQSNHDRLEALEQCLEAVTDHEAIHQRLHETASALARGKLGLDARQ